MLSLEPRWRSSRMHKVKTRILFACFMVEPSLQVQFESLVLRPASLREQAHSKQQATKLKQGAP